MFTSGGRKVTAMHGRKKVSAGEAHRIKQQQKAKHLKEEIHKALDPRTDPAKAQQLVATATNVLDYLDDFATLWNMRKQTFLAEPSVTAAERELAISRRVLGSNAKSYWAWHHRRWCIEQLEAYDYSSEVAVTDEFLKRDCRNFHAWRHRRWAVPHCEGVAESELRRSTELIGQETGNFSAWHYRSQLVDGTNFKDEIDMAKSAFWTEPREQSAWIYYRWLIGRDIPMDAEFLEAELRDMTELAETVPTVKYPFLAIIWLQKKLHGPDADITDVKAKLSEIDPIRAPYYAEQ
jgi:geranylgeranyl transferase type-2 subunit alpha